MSEERSPTVRRDPARVLWRLAIVLIVVGAALEAWTGFQWASGSVNAPGDLGETIVTNFTSQAAPSLLTGGIVCLGLALAVRALAASAGVGSADADSHDNDRPEPVRYSVDSSHRPTSETPPQPPASIDPETFRRPTSPT